MCGIHKYVKFAEIDQTSILASLRSRLVDNLTCEPDWVAYPALSEGYH